MAPLVRKGPRLRLPLWLCGAVHNRLRATTSHKRKPDFVVGNPVSPYLRRWYVIPRNRFLNIYYHEFLRSDEDRALHDHPWASMSVILSGGYVEVMPENDGDSDVARAVVHRRVFRFTGQVSMRGPRALHRVELHGHQFGCPAPAYTLFITGPKVRDWGFLCLNGWVPWQHFTKKDGKGEVGPGCEGNTEPGRRQP